MIILQIAVVVLCVVNIYFLLRTRQSKPVTFLILSLVSCFFMNVGYLLLMQQTEQGATRVGLDIQYLGNSMFFFFFLLFIFYFLHAKHHKWDKWLLLGWFLIEFAGIVLLWVGNYKNLVFSEISYDWNLDGRLMMGGDSISDPTATLIPSADSEDTEEIVLPEETEEDEETIEESLIDLTTYTGVKTKLGPLYMIRYAIICVILSLCLINTICRFIHTKVPYERRNLLVIICAVAAMVFSVTYMLACRPDVDITPGVSSIVLMIITCSIKRGNFFQAKDIGRDMFVDETNNIFIMADPKYGFLDCNERAVALFPELAPKTHGMPLSEQIKNLFTGDDESLWIGDYGYKVSRQELWEKKILLGYSLMLTDITELQEAMDKAKSATEAKSAFLSNMSHEIRTPMNAIVGVTEIMLRDEHTPEDQEYLTTIANSGQSLLSIINDILDYSKIESGKMEIIDYEYDVYSILNDLNMIFTNRVGTKDVKLIYDVDWTIPAMLYGDGNRIRQVVINIVNNAIKFTDHGSVTIKISSERLPDDKIHLFFSVKDTGIGIKPEDMGKLFNSFEQVDTKKNRSKEGTGLGLAISKKLIERMGGEIKINSVYGEGTEMIFDVVQVIRSKQVIGDLRNTVLAKPKEEYVHFKAPDAKVLIVDDNAINLKVAVGLLAPLSMQITTAGSGFEALNKVALEKFDLIFMDHMMPQMDGVETTQRIRALDDYHKTVPIVALTANAISGVSEELKAAGMTDYVSKPISMKQITKVLAKHLPQDKVHYEEGEEVVEDQPVEESEFTKALRTVQGLNVDEGLVNTGSEKLLEELVRDWCKIVELKVGRIQEYLRDQDYKNFTVEVHDVKGTSRVIGATDVSEMYKELEMLGKESNGLKIASRLVTATAEYTALRDRIRAAIPKDEAEADENLSTDMKDISMLLQGIKEAAESIDVDSIDDIMKKLKHTIAVKKAGDIFEKMEAYVANLEVENIEAASDEILKKLEGDSNE